MRNRWICFLFTGCALSTAYGAEGSYVYYECPTEQAAYACDSSCKKTLFTTDFRVNVSSSVVLMTNYHEGKVLSSGALEDCKVVDKRNWACTTKMHQRRDITYVMNDGIFSYLSFWKVGDFSGFSCARARGLFN